MQTPPQLFDSISMSGDGCGWVLGHTFCRIVTEQCFKLQEPSGYCKKLELIVVAYSTRRQALLECLSSQACRSNEAGASTQAPSKAEAATQCLNAMITDALQHLPYSLEYLELLRHKKVRTARASRLRTAMVWSSKIIFAICADFVASQNDQAAA